MYILENDRLNLNCLGDYFSEGFRQYYEDIFNKTKILRNHDILLFKYIEGVVGNE